MEGFIRNSLTRTTNGFAAGNENERDNDKTNPKDEFIIHFFPPPVNI
jgi:hypothetical protein